MIDVLVRVSRRVQKDPAYAFPRGLLCVSASLWFVVNGLRVSPWTARDHTTLTATSWIPLLP